MIRINLIPTKAEHKRRGAYLQLGVGGAAVAAALIACVFINTSIDAKIEREQATITDLNNQITKLKSVIAEVEDYKKKRRDLESKIQTIKDLNDKRTGPVKLMDEFSVVLPRKAWITAYSEMDKKLTIEGRAMDGATVSDFIQSLRESKFFYNVQLVQVEQVDEAGKRVQKFGIVCQVNYFIPGSA